MFSFFMFLPSCFFCLSLYCFAIPSQNFAPYRHALASPWQFSALLSCSMLCLRSAVRCLAIQLRCVTLQCFHCVASPLPCSACLRFAVALFFFVRLCYAFAPLGCALPLPRSACSRLAVAPFFAALQCYALATLCVAMPFRCNADLLRALSHLQSVLSSVHRLADNPALHVFDFQRFPSRFRHILFSPLSGNDRDSVSAARMPQAACLPLRSPCRQPAAPA